MDSAGDAVKEDDDESSSSSSNVQNALDEFREKWQQELKKDNTGCSSLGKSGSTSYNELLDKENLSIEQQAKVLFIQGAELERTGKVFEAMRFYRRAVQLVPDIEFKVYDKKVSVQKQDPPSKSCEIEQLTLNLIETNLQVGENLEKVDLALRFQTLLAKSGKLFEMASSADRMLIVTSAHFSDLPMEVILYILHWVVSSEMDLKSLERFSSVCRGFYLLARDQEIWKRACLR